MGVIDALHGEVEEYVFLDWMLKSFILSTEVSYVRKEVSKSV